MSIWVTAHLPLPYTQQQSTGRGTYFYRYDDVTYHDRTEKRVDCKYLPLSPTKP